MDIYIPLVSGFIGAIIGAAASIITMMLQLRAQDRRERLRIAAEVGIEDYRQTLQFHKDKGDAFFVAPMGSYVYHHIKLMEMIEQGDLTPDRIAKLTEEVSKISAVTRPDTLSK